MFCWCHMCFLPMFLPLGLTHLHEELPATSTEGPKPSIVHRDFKSKNVLLSTNFRACIADFGLAIVFHPNTVLGDAHGQVGTRRYMAPEVLEGMYLRYLVFKKIQRKSWTNLHNFILKLHKKRLQF